MYRITPDERAATYVSWIERTKLVPSKLSPESLERNLAYAYSALRSKDRNEAEETAFQRMAAAREAAWKARAEAGLTRRSFKSKGMVTAKRVEAFYREHGRLPLASRDNEAKFYGDVRNIRHRWTVGELPGETVAVLEKVPGLLTAVRKPPLPELDKLEAWCAANKRMPRHGIGRPHTPEDELEVYLGRWLYRHVNRRPGAKETDTTRGVRARILALQAIYPPTSAVKASAEARQVLDFMKREGRFPDRHRETLLYGGAVRLRRIFAAREGRFGADIAKFLAATVGLPSPAESSWDGQFAEAREFAAAEGRLPSMDSESGSEVKLAEWLAAAPYIDSLERRGGLDTWLDGFRVASAA